MLQIRIGFAGAGAPMAPLCKGLAKRCRRNDLSAKLTEGLTTPPSKIEDFAHLPLHRGGFGAVRNPISRTVAKGEKLHDKLELVNQQSQP